MRFILSEVIKPATHRVGSSLGIYLATLEYFTAGQVETLATAATVVAGFLVDLMIRKVL